jgi:BASS family bile acid:Na+ symporter
VILLIVFAIGLMDGVGERLVSEPRHVLTMIAIAFAANIGLQAVSAAAFLFAGRRRALTTGFLAGNRNMALLLAVLPAGTDPDVSLYFALGQFPLYILPMVMIPVYRHLLRHSVERA